VHDREADRRSASGGLDDDGKAQRVDDLHGRPIPGRPGGGGDTGRLEELFRETLVHRHRRAQRAGPGIADPGEVEHRLQLAVLGRAAVQRQEDDVRLTYHVRLRDAEQSRLVERRPQRVHIGRVDAHLGREEVGFLIGRHVAGRRVDRVNGVAARSKRLEHLFAR
jgi:hypothetical protein